MKVRKQLHTLQQLCRKHHLNAVLSRYGHLKLLLHHHINRNMMYALENIEGTLAAR